MRPVYLTVANSECYPMNTFVRQGRPAIFVLVVSLALIIGSFQVEARDNGVTATVGANVISLQAGPGLDFSSIGTATLGQRFPVIGRAHGSNRIWYEIELPSGGTAWVSERVVNIDPSPDSLPWVGDNVAKTPLIMDCGKIRPTLFVGAYAQVTWDQGVILNRDAGLGKPQIGNVAAKGFVKVLDGPFCTLLNFNTKRYQIQWLVVNQTGIKGYMLEGVPNSTQLYVQLTKDAPASDFAATDATSTATSAATSAAPATPAVNNNTARPAFVTDDDIQAATSIFQAVQDNKITEAQATSDLQALVDGHDPALLPWIVRRVPVYDGKLHQWISFARYDDMSIMDFSPGSQLDVDPVTTTITILFGKYTNAKQEFQSVGCGGG